MLSGSGVKMKFLINSGALRNIVDEESQGALKLKHVKCTSGREKHHTDAD